MTTDHMIELGLDFERDSDLADLVSAWKNSPYPSTKVSHYFPTYAKLFGTFRQRPITIVETGVLGGGSLFMWREWFGPQARIVGIDMNPAAKKWIDHGFEIHIGDQGDPMFWADTLKKIGALDIFLDDGGHQSFQQIVTVEAVLRHISKRAVVVVEDTHCSFMTDFSRHGEHSFHEYAKACLDFLTMRMSRAYPGRMPAIENNVVSDMLRNVTSIQFYTGMVAFELDPRLTRESPQVLWNAAKPPEQDFRYRGKSSASIQWPVVSAVSPVVVQGGSS